ncbi:O-fucosyltransferase 23-like [Cucurbita pepo subsp. pepo]|uniref:O-fucosyltransferase 23-like n=1 Tax=Cucurbita pepo subsp. pepo TaxID=3664 RepID=UPI000C9D457D|nr:O-fucosyltransferase 23-like [Cucurbita pepo subsp. pepo]XP_023519480.1 O-fucosyltransferase 23-like [Cucurbita pepo subsp. pepo]XP_023519481.1 O-fucosyltransferase 23-like [Cucurbita pepo subsp. pepo]XP_023519482.1 O-fucosyltransferase 23-like [Cucurbita pepo subsp. pepo]XP_023519483.1 O-fucosyltransferase 23-like [Cucurbita pepo subsp. pepo]
MEVSSNGKRSIHCLRYLNSRICKCIAILLVLLIVRAIFFPSTLSFGWTDDNGLVLIRNLSPFYGSNFGIRIDKFLEVPQIVWGLNNQKIAFARACLTARMLNRTLLMPSLSASLFYKEVERLEPISFDKIFKFNEFNSRCNGFVRLGRYMDVSNRAKTIELPKGSGRKWTIERDFEQLKEYSKEPFDQSEVIRIVGKNPFLWHDHWPVKDYARVFECLVLVDEIANEADKVISRIREVGSEEVTGAKSAKLLPYVAVHMRIEIDWMIHCKKLEQRYNMNQICSSKEEIMSRVGNISGTNTPTVVYLAVADSLLNDSSILDGWKEGLLPFEKKKLGIDKIYEKYPYLIRSAIDYEVCSRADVFVGNSFSTFSSLVVLGRTQKLMKAGVAVGELCSRSVMWPSYAYNILGDSKGRPQKWVANMSDISLQKISYGSNDTSCR